MKTFLMDLDFWHISREKKNNLKGYKALYTRNNYSNEKISAKDLLS